MQSTIREGCASGEQDHRNVRLERLQCQCYRLAVHARHFVVGDNQVDVTTCSNSYSHLAGRCRQNAISQSFEHGAVHLQADLKVVDPQQGGFRVACRVYRGNAWRTCPKYGLHITANDGDSCTFRHSRTVSVCCCEKQCGERCKLPTGKPVGAKFDLKNDFPRASS